MILIFRNPVFLLGLALFACKQPAGEGGTSTIKGTVTYAYEDTYGTAKGSAPAAEERVYLVYGEDDIYSDDIRTHSDGVYQFKYLRKGNYTVFAYQDCPACPGGKETVTATLAITDNKSIISDGDLSLRRILDIDDGIAVIRGKVFLRDLDQGGQLIEEYYVPERRVYISYENEAENFDDIRTSADGSYAFKGLIPGDYTLSAYSQCDSCPGGTEAIQKTVSVSADDQTIQVPDIVILD